MLSTTIFFERREPIKFGNQSWHNTEIIGKNNIWLKRNKNVKRLMITKMLKWHYIQCVHIYKVFNLGTHELSLKQMQSSMNW